MKIFLEKLWLWKLLAKLTVDLGFCTGKIDFCCNIIVDYFVKLWYNFISIIDAQLGVPTQITVWSKNYK